MWNSTFPKIVFPHGPADKNLGTAGPMVQWSNGPRPNFSYDVETLRIHNKLRLSEASLAGCCRTHRARFSCENKVLRIVAELRLNEANLREFDQPYSLSFSWEVDFFF